MPASDIVGPSFIRELACSNVKSNKLQDVDLELFIHKCKTDDRIKITVVKQRGSYEKD
jgi:hypothetical protein